MLLSDYEYILKSLVNSDWVIGGIESFIKSPISQSVLLRHDVDRRPNKAVAMARLEKEHGVTSTYYFRVDKNGDFPVWAIKLISSLGHEIGYHYETLVQCNGELNKAITLFKENLSTIREVANCKTISMHGSPLSKINNHDLFAKYDLTEFDLLGDAVLTISKFKPLYFTDVGGQWNHTSVNIRDSIPESRKDTRYNSLTNDIDLLLNDDPGPIYISTHPERWAEGFLDRVYCSSLDISINILKRIIKTIRSISSTS